MLQDLDFWATHTAQLALGGWRPPGLLIALKSCCAWIPERSCCPSGRHGSQAPGLLRHTSRRACMQTDTPRLARICYRVLQSGQKHLLKKNAVTAHTHVFRFCSNSPLLFARHVSMLMLHYPQGDIQQLSSTTTRSISFQVKDFQEVQKFPIDFPAVKFCGHRQKKAVLTSEQTYWLNAKIHWPHNSVTGYGQWWMLGELSKDIASKH